MPPTRSLSVQPVLCVKTTNYTVVRRRRLPCMRDRKGARPRALPLPSHQIVRAYSRQILKESKQSLQPNLASCITAGSCPLSDRANRRQRVCRQSTQQPPPPPRALREKERTRLAPADFLGKNYTQMTFSLYRPAQRPPQTRIPLLFLAGL